MNNREIAGGLMIGFGILLILGAVRGTFGKALHELNSAIPPLDLSLMSVGSSSTSGATPAARSADTLGSDRRRDVLGSDRPPPGAAGSGVTTQ